MNGGHDSPGPLKSSRQLFIRDYKLVHRSLKITGVGGSVLFTVTVCWVTLKGWGWAAGRKVPCSHCTAAALWVKDCLFPRADELAWHRKRSGVESREAREKKQHTHSKWETCCKSKRWLHCYKPQRWWNPPTRFLQGHAGYFAEVSAAHQAIALYRKQQQTWRRFMQGYNM